MDFSMHSDVFKTRPLLSRGASPFASYTLILTLFALFISPCDFLFVAVRTVAHLPSSPSSPPPPRPRLAEPSSAPSLSLSASPLIFVIAPSCSHIHIHPFLSNPTFRSISKPQWILRNCNNTACKLLDKQPLSNILSTRQDWRGSMRSANR